MRFLRPRAKPSENIALAAMGSAILGVFSLLLAFFPSLSVPLALLLPIVSVLIGYLLAPLYLIPYVLAASFVCYAVASFNPSEVLFAVIPSIFTGTLLGFLLSKKLGVALPLLCVSLLQLGLDYVILLMLQGLFSLDPIATFRALFGIEDSPLFRSWLPAALLLLSYAQSLITIFIMMILKNGFASFFPEKGRNKIVEIVLSSLGVLTGALAIVLGLYEATSGQFFLVLAFLLAFSALFEFRFEEGTLWLFIGTGSFLLGALLLRAFLGQKYPNPPILSALFAIVLSLMSLLGTLLPKRAKEGPSA